MCRSSRLKRGGLLLVNLMYQFDWAKGCSESRWNIVSCFLLCVRGCFQKGNWIHIWIHKLSEADDPDQCRQASSNPRRTRIEQKGRGREQVFFLLDLRHASSPAVGLWCSWLLPSRLEPAGSWAFGLGLNYTLAFSALQLVTWSPSTVTVTLYLLFYIQADLGGIAGSVPDHRNKANIAVKRVTWIFGFPAHFKGIFILYGSLLSVWSQYV